MSDQIEKSDPDRVDECEDRRLPFSLADSRALIVWGGERENDRRGMSRVEVGDGMMTVGWASEGPLTFLDPENQKIPIAPIEERDEAVQSGDCRKPGPPRVLSKRGTQ